MRWICRRSHASSEAAGEVLDRRPPPPRTAVEQALENLRGEIELPVPAASAVKIEGRRAYLLARQGVTVQMPIRRSTVYALAAVSWTGSGDTVSGVRLELQVSSGTYVRSIAQALGGHCTSLRRTAIGPFGVDEAVAVEVAELIPASAALARLPGEAVERVPAAIRAGVLALEPPLGGGVA